MDTCTSMKFRGIIVFAQLNTSNKPKSHKLKRIGTTVSKSSSSPEFLSTGIYKPASLEA
jgi:hypothetical protein